MPLARFPRRARLDEFAVKALLKSGRRLASAPPIIGVRYDTRAAKGAGACIAIAVPKRILKRAVDRNYVKRVVRERFRQHLLANVPVHLLVSLQAKPEGAMPDSGLTALTKSVFDQVLAKLRPPKPASAA